MILTFNSQCHRDKCSIDGMEYLKVSEDTKLYKSSHASLWVCEASDVISYEENISTFSFFTLLSLFHFIIYDILLEISFKE